MEDRHVAVTAGSAINATWRLYNSWKRDANRGELVGVATGALGVNTALLERGDGFSAVLTWRVTVSFPISRSVPFVFK